VFHQAEVTVQTPQLHTVVVGVRMAEMGLVLRWMVVMEVHQLIWQLQFLLHRGYSMV